MPWSISSLSQLSFRRKAIVPSESGHMDETTRRWLRSFGNGMALIGGLR